MSYSKVPATLSMVALGRTAWNWISKPFHRDAARDVGVTAGIGGIAATAEMAARVGTASIVATVPAAVAVGAVTAYSRCRQCHSGPLSPGYYANLMGYC